LESDASLTKGCGVDEQINSLASSTLYHMMHGAMLLLALVIAATPVIAGKP
jgi:hypothetical protein